MGHDCSLRQQIIEDLHHRIEQPAEIFSHIEDKGIGALFFEPLNCIFKLVGRVGIEGSDANIADTIVEQPGFYRYHINPLAGDLDFLLFQLPAHHHFEGRPSSPSKAATACS